MAQNRTRAAAVLAAAALALAACGQADPEPEKTPDTSAEAAPETSAQAPETDTPATTSQADASTASATESSISESSSPTSTAAEEEKRILGEVRERFATIAPPEFFDQLDGCVEADLEGYYDCAGDQVGQFQFFDSESKAASTTQVLTELRSSKIVEDSGDRVVGWSTVGTSAIVTVVDNREGQVMQHLVSTDREDPRQRIYDLGLAEHAR